MGLRWQQPAPATGKNIRLCRFSDIKSCISPATLWYLTLDALPFHAAMQINSAWHLVITLSYKALHIVEFQWEFNFTRSSSSGFLAHCLLCRKMIQQLHHPPSGVVPQIEPHNFWWSVCLFCSDCTMVDGPVLSQKGWKTHTHACNLIVNCSLFTMIPV